MVVVVTFRRLRIVTSNLGTIYEKENITIVILFILLIDSQISKNP